MRKSVEIGLSALAGVVGICLLQSYALLLKCNICCLGNTCAGKNVVELIKHQRIVETVGGLLCLGIPTKNREKLGIVESLLETSVIHFQPVICGISTTVKLEIKLAEVGGQFLTADALHEVGNGGVLNLNLFRGFLGEESTGNHLVCRSATAIAKAVSHEIGIALTNVSHVLKSCSNGLLVYPCVNSVEVNGDFAAVNSLPHEGLIGEGICVVPAELCCKEILNSTALHDLRKSGRIAEGIGKPECVGFVAELVTEISLTTDELTAECLGSGKVAVTFNPGCAVALKSALGNKLTNLAEELGIVLLNPLKVENGGHEELVALVSLKESYCIGNGTKKLSSGLLNRPKPCCIKMAVTYNAYVGTLLFGGEMLFHNSGRLIKLRRIGLAFFHWNCLKNLDIDFLNFRLFKAICAGIVKFS